MEIIDQSPSQAVQLFEPSANVVYTIDAAGQICRMPRRVILLCYKYGLVSLAADPMREGYYLNDEAIRTLRRIESLRTDQGINLAGIKMILPLLKEVEQLRAGTRRFQQV